MLFGRLPVKRLQTERKSVRFLNNFSAHTWTPLRLIIQTIPTEDETLQILWRAFFSGCFHQQRNIWHWSPEDKPDGGASSSYQATVPCQDQGIWHSFRDTGKWSFRVRIKLDYNLLFMHREMIPSQVRVQYSILYKRQMGLVFTRQGQGWMLLKIVR